MASVINNQDICPECGNEEHIVRNSSGDASCENCGWEEVCEFCHGSGTTHEDVDDGEGHLMRGVGKEIPCICQIEK